MTKARDLVIVGAGAYGAVAKEVAESMGCFGRIVFADDFATVSYCGDSVVCTVDGIAELSPSFSSIAVAIGNPAVRLSLIESIDDGGLREIVSLVSPLAYVSPNAELERGCIVEPMSVIHTGCKLGRGCIISAGAVINHASTLGEGVHVDCNATVAGYADVPSMTKVYCGTVFEAKKINSI